MFAKRVAVDVNAERRSRDGLTDASMDLGNFSCSAWVAFLVHFWCINWRAGGRKMDTAGDGFFRILLMYLRKRDYYRQ